MDLSSTIRELLLSGINREELINNIAASFYDQMLIFKKNQPHLFEAILGTDTIGNLSKLDVSGLEFGADVYIDELLEMIDYQLQMAFDQVEDSVKKEFTKGRYYQPFLEDMKEHKIVPMKDDNGETLSVEDNVEMFYLSAFRAFDDLRVSIQQEILSVSPQKFMERGRKTEDAYNAAHGLLMDDRDFFNYYDMIFDRGRLWQSFERKIYDTIHYSTHYYLEDLSEEEEEDQKWRDDEEEEQEEGGLLSNVDEEETEDDQVLVRGEDMKPEDFDYVYELMDEYTGHRVLTPDENGQNAAYWTLWGDDFQDLLNDYMIQILEKTIRYFNEQKPIQYASYAKYYHWNKEQQKDPLHMMETNDNLYTGLQERQEELWNDFEESKLEPLYEEGRKLAEGKKQ